MTKPHAVCATCPHRDTCMSSAWNESGHPHPPAETSGVTDLTFVHTCRSCFEHTLTDYKDKNLNRRVVPDECPRWHPTAGSALDCNACQAERDQLRAADPRWLAGLAASGKLFANLLAKVRVRATHGPDIVDLDVEKEADEAITELVAATSPLAPLEAALTTEVGKVEYGEASDLLVSLLNTVWADPVFVHEREVCKKDWDIQMHQFDWLHGLKLVMDRHWGNPEAVVHEWMLVFTERPIASRTWTRWSVPRRREILAGWEQVAAKKFTPVVEH